jgi:hypothetical protein
MRSVVNSGKAQHIRQHLQSSITTASCIDVISHTCDYALVNQDGVHLIHNSAAFIAVTTYSTAHRSSLLLLLISMLN